MTREFADFLAELNSEDASYVDGSFGGQALHAVEEIEHRRS